MQFKRRWAFRNSERSDELRRESSYWDKKLIDFSIIIYPEIRNSNKLNKLILSYLKNKAPTYYKSSIDLLNMLQKSY